MGGIGGGEVHEGWEGEWEGGIGVGGGEGEEEGGMGAGGEGRDWGVRDGRGREEGIREE